LSFFSAKKNESWSRFDLFYETTFSWLGLETAISCKSISAQRMCWLAAAPPPSHGRPPGMSDAHMILPIKDQKIWVTQSHASFSRVPDGACRLDHQPQANEIQIASDCRQLRGARDGIAVNEQVNLRPAKTAAL
jgi:hypothetical protein